jgi:hypothetical protein
MNKVNIMKSWAIFFLATNLISLVISFVKERYIMGILDADTSSILLFGTISIIVGAVVSFLVFRRSVTSYLINNVDS